MKKLFRILSLILCAVVAAVTLSACSDYGAPDYKTSTPNYAVSQSDLESELGAFMSSNVDRTTYTDGESKAALYLSNRLIEMGFTDVGLQEFSTSEAETNSGVVKSQNVVAHIGSGKSTAKNVILGAYYDNRYKAPYNGAKSDGAEGVVSGGTSVATLLVIADYIAHHTQGIIDNDLQITVVFFGASYVADDGARAYLDKMTEREYKRTVLMVELQRLGVDHVYAFSDARQTNRESFFDDIAKTNGLNIYKPTTKSPVITGLSALNGVPYYQWVHNGLFSRFFNAGIPTLNLVGANWETANLSDRESATRDNLAYTENDTLRNLKRYYPNYADKMATAATLVIRSVYSSDFTDAMLYDKENFPDTDTLSSAWIWCLVVLLVVLAVAGAMYAVGMRLKKKYPIAPIAQPQMKMAVFGMDYEDKNSGDIYIDIRDGGSFDDDIFPGVQNNAHKAANPFDEIFMQYGKQGNDREGNNQNDNSDDNDDPFDLPPDGK